MAVMRLSSSVVTETGEAMTVIAENFEEFQPAFTLYSAGTPTPEAYVRVTRDNPDGNLLGLIGWGAGIKALFLTTTFNGAPTGKLIPVVALMPDSDSATSGPFSATLIESAVDPVLQYFETEKKFVLYYWINAWSPPPLFNYSTSPSPSPPSQSKSTLFEGVKPPLPSLIDYKYWADPSYQGPQPFPRYTAVRNVPNWYLDGKAPESPVDSDLLDLVIPPMTKISERLGPIDVTRFWVAPFTDAHLFRFPANYDPFPPPPIQDPHVPPSPPPGPPGPPLFVLPPPVITEPPASFIGNFPYLTYPFSKTTQTLTSILYNVKQGLYLRPSERSTLDTYVLALERLMGLDRCSRILMQTEGWLMVGNQQDDPDQLTSTYRPVPTKISEENDTYLIVKYPRPVLALERGINKVLLGRPKMTSFLGTDFFITAALTYRYPAAATVSLCAGNPHVDFTIQCPSDHFDEYRRMGSLPESLTPQIAPPIVGKSILIPGGYPTSLIEALSISSYW